MAAAVEPKECGTTAQVVEVAKPNVPMDAHGRATSSPAGRPLSPAGRPPAGLPSTHASPCRRGRSATPEQRTSDSSPLPLHVNVAKPATVAASPEGNLAASTPGAWSPDAAAACAATPAAGMSSGGGECPKKELQPSVQALIASRPGRANRPNIAKSENAEGRAMYSVGSAEHSAKSSQRSRLSTEDMEALRAEEARRELSEKIKRNAKTCHQAIHYPDAEVAPGSLRRSLHVTVPQEFSLSTSVSRSRRRSRSSEDAADRQNREWQQSLRQDDAPNSARSTSRSRDALRLHLTVAEGPNLRTAMRARSRSVGSRGSSVSRGIDSECATPDGSARSTPRRGRSCGVRTPLRPREQSAVEHFYERLASARTPSASPARSRKAARAESPSATPSRRSRPCSFTPTRPGQTTPGTPGSVQSRMERLSQLSQRTPCNHHNLSTADLLELRVEQKRQDLHEMRLQNERNYREAISNPDVGKPLPRPSLTVPHGPELKTAMRARSRSAARSRSVTPECSVDGRSVSSVASERRAAKVEQGSTAAGVPQDQNVEDWIQAGATPQERAERARASAQAKVERETETVGALLRRPLGSFNAVVPVREQAAIKKHVERVAGGSENADVACAQTSAVLPPAEGDIDEWIQQGASAQERAERARAAAQAKVDKELEKKKTLLGGVFRGADKPRPKNATTRPGQKPRSIFTPTSALEGGCATPSTAPSPPVEAAEDGGITEYASACDAVEQAAEQTVVAEVEVRAKEEAADVKDEASPAADSCEQDYGQPTAESLMTELQGEGAMEPQETPLESVATAEPGAAAKAMEDLEAPTEVIDVRVPAEAVEGQHIRPEDPTESKAARTGSAAAVAAPLTRSPSGGRKGAPAAGRVVATGIRSPRVQGRSPQPGSGSSNAPRAASVKKIGASPSSPPVRPTTPHRRTGAVAADGASSAAASGATSNAASGGGYGFGSRTSRPCLR